MWLDNFNHLRENSGFSLDELSARSGVPKGTLSKITAGITKAPSIETIKSLVYAMGYTLADLDDSSPSFELTKAELSHVEKYRSLDGHGQKMVDIVLHEEHERCKQTEKPILEIVQQPKEAVDLYEFLSPVSFCPCQCKSGASSGFQGFTPLFSIFNNRYRGIIAAKNNKKPS